MLLLFGASTLAAEPYLEARVPEGWTQTSSVTTRTLQVAHYRSADARQRLVYESLREPNPINPLEYLEQWRLQQTNVCARVEDFNVYSGEENGYPAAVHILWCRQDEGAADLTSLVKVIRAPAALFTAVWTYTQAPAQATTIDTPLVGEWLQILRDVTACDPASGAHPCATQN